jgi:hypothetical protein
MCVCLASREQEKNGVNGMDRFYNFLHALAPAVGCTHRKNG